MKSVLIILEGLPLTDDRRAWSQATSLVETGYKVAVITPALPGEPASETHEGIRIHRYKRLLEPRGRWGYLVEYGHAFLIVSWLAWRVHRRDGFDAIQAASPPDFLFLIAMLYKLFFGKKFIFDHRDLSPELYVARFGKPPRSLIHRILLWLERRSYSVADVVMTINESTKALCSTRNGKDLSRVFVVRCAPDTRWFKPVSQRPRLRAGRKHLVCYVGIMGPQDGVECLLYAIDHIVRVQQRADISFALLGGGDHVPTLKSLAHELGVEDFVEFTGMVRDDTLLLAYLSTADVCVSPEPRNDLNDKCSFIKIAEYMAVGKPVIAFNMPETCFSAGDAAAYARPNDCVDFANKLMELLDDPERRRRMGEAAVQRSRDLLSWDHSRQHLLAAYGLLFMESTERRDEPRSEVRLTCGTDG